MPAFMNSLALATKDNPASAGFFKSYKRNILNLFLQYEKQTAEFELIKRIR